MFTWSQVDTTKSRLKSCAFLIGTLENISTSRRDGGNFDNNLRLGYDYELGKKVILGVLVSGYDNRWEMDALNRVERLKNAMANLNLLIRPREGSELTLNIDYLFYGNRNPIHYDNDYYEGRDKFLVTRKLLSSKNVVYGYCRYSSITPGS